jgi:cell division protein FtsB
MSDLGQRLLRYALFFIIGLLLYALILGKGGQMRIHDLQVRIAAQKEANAQQQTRNEAMTADVMDLRKGGTDALEDRARSELGMVRQGETYYRFVDPPAKGNP